MLILVALLVVFGLVIAAGVDRRVADSLNTLMWLVIFALLAGFLALVAWLAILGP
jgi:cytochrome bd-type quinol oxidase subunit 2